MRLLPPDPPLRDEVVVLRPLDERDVATIERALRDPEIAGWFGVSSLSASEWLTRRQKGWHHATAAAFAICEPDGTCVGSVHLEPRDAGTADLGYWLLPNSRGRGLATRAVRLMSRWALEQVGVARLQLWAAAENTASQRVAERSGFKREGVLRSYAETDGRRVDAVFFSLLPSDLVGQAATL